MTRRVETRVAGLAATARGDAPRVVLLHAGIADRRSWHPVMDLRPLSSVAYDRPGFGTTPPPSGPFSDRAQLGAVLDGLDCGPVTLVGNSQGGRVAIDYALASPERVARLVLVAPAVRGEPELVLDGALGEAAAAIDAAEQRADLDAVNRIEVRVWLDGIGAPEGRVSGPVRDLVLDMNAIALRGAADDDGNDPPAWERLEDLRPPVTVVIGDLDLPGVIARARAIVARTRGDLVLIPGAAHLPQLERPDLVARVISAAVG
jgi:pimeloyl-ACP methyl ester carboxylesterase